MVIRIFIADDHPIVWDGLRQIVSEQGDMRVVGAVASGDALLAALQQQELPDVVVCDMSMPGRSGIELIKALRTGWPGLPVLALGVDDAGMHALPAIRWVAGAASTSARTSPESWPMPPVAARCCRTQCFPNASSRCSRCWSRDWPCRLLPNGCISASRPSAPTRPISCASWE